MTKFSLLAALLFASCQPTDHHAAEQRRGPSVAAPVATPGVPSPVVVRQVAADEDPGLDVTAPFALTASDGSGLSVTRIDAKAVVQGPLAFTELHLYFKNPESRIRE